MNSVITNNIDDYTGEMYLLAIDIDILKNWFNIINKKGLKSYRQFRAKNDLQ